MRAQDEVLDRRSGSGSRRTCRAASRPRAPRPGSAKREPSTRSASPRGSGRPSPGSASGSYCPSGCSITTTSASCCSASQVTRLLVAAVADVVRDARSPAAAASRASSTVSSVDLSSTRMISSTHSVGIATVRSASRRVERGHDDRDLHVLAPAGRRRRWSVVRSLHGRPAGRYLKLSPPSKLPRLCPGRPGSSSGHRGGDRGRGGCALRSRRLAAHVRPLDPRPGGARLGRLVRHRAGRRALRARR